jgi:glycosyltransferase involved in cell wall biosynthesis
LAGRLLRKKVLIKYVGDPNWEKLRSQGIIATLPKFLTQKQPSLQKSITKFVLFHADTIIVPAHHLKNLLVTGYQISPTKIIVVPNSVEKISLETRKTPGRILFVGRLVKWKNVNLIIEAISYFKKSTGVVFQIIGDGPEEKDLKALVTKLELENKVVFLGKLSHIEVMKKMAESKLLILYSDYEGLPHVALEAMSVGTIPILSSIPGNNEINTAVLVTSRNPQSLAQELESLLNDKNRMKSLSKMVKMEIEKTYSWEKNINDLKKIFDSLCFSNLH